MKNASFPWKDFVRRIAVIAIPVALQNLLTTTGSMVDTMMIGALGDENIVGAVGLCAQFTSLMFSGYWGFVGGGMLFFAQYWGAKDDDGIDRSYGITLSFMMLVAAVFASLALFLPEWVMKVYTDKTVLQEIGVRYLRIVGFAYPMQILSMAMSCLLRSTERVRIPFYAAIASVLTNMVLNWVLIYGRFGLPAMGVAGAAIATILGQISSMTLGIILNQTRNKELRISFRGFHPNGDLLRSILSVGFPSIIMQAISSVMNVLLNMILLGFGIVQVGLSLKSHDPSQRANGFLTLAGGIIITFTKEILTMITGG